MSGRCLYLPAVSLALFIAAGKASAQLPARVIRGEVRGVADYSHLTAELFDEANHHVVDRQLLNWTGEFEFRAEPGNYQVRVATTRGDILQSAYVHSVDTGVPVTIQLPEPFKSAPVNGKVSVLELSRLQNKPLMRKFQNAEEAARRGDFRASVAHLEQVVAIDPSFTGAYVNLGVRYARLNLSVHARGAFLRAIELEPTLLIAYTNLALTDLAFGDPEGATAAAVAALRLSPDDAIALKVIASARKVVERSNSFLHADRSRQ